MKQIASNTAKKTASWKQRAIAAEAVLHKLLESAPCGICGLSPLSWHHTFAHTTQPDTHEFVLPAWVETIVSRQTTVPEAIELLSPAERRVANAICEGLTSRQIGSLIDRSPSTVRNQTIAIYRKLGVTTRTALVALMLNQI